MKSESLRVRLIGVGYLIAWRITRLLPESAARRMWAWSSRRAHRKNARRRAIVRANLLPVVGEGPALDKAVADAFDSYGRYWVEAFRLQDMSDVELHRRITFEGAEHVDAAIAGGGGVFGVTHIGNWDAAGRYFAKRWGLAVVVEVLRPRALFDRFVAYRRGLGMTIIPLVRGGDVLGQCVKEIAGGTLLALVCDRDLSGTGVDVTMFGRRTRLPAGPAIISLRAGVPLMPATTLHFPDGTYRARVGPPITTGQEKETPEEVARIMQLLADEFAKIIAEHPDQWHAFVPYWLDDMAAR